MQKVIKMMFDREATRIALRKVKRKVLPGTIDLPAKEMFSAKSKLEEAKKWVENTDQDHIWAFNSGNDGDAFRGNPKYLFVYISKYRPDIKAYWVSKNHEIISQISEGVGLKAYDYDSPAAEYLMSKTGVVVNEQVRGLIPFKNDVKYLNLWHGHGFKSCERGRVDDDDDMRLELSRKYIKNNSFFQNNMIVCCVNPLQERYFLNYMGVPKEHMLHAGYARCTYQQKYEPIKTFEHDIRALKGISSKAKIIVYAPTFRSKRGNTFNEAITDLEALYKCCEKNNFLFVFKMHPLMENEAGFIEAKRKYGNRPYFYFWKNSDDFYEIMPSTDLVIYDYSSMFNDFLLSGVRKYIRYIYDYDTMVTTACVNSEEEYYRYTYGTICKNFEELIRVLPLEAEKEAGSELDEIVKEQWEYSGEDDFEKTIDFTMKFKVGGKIFPTLYSFDIFDTLIHRKGLEPRSIFFAVQDRIKDSGLYDNTYFVKQYPRIRSQAEKCVREYMNKTVVQRKSIKTEIKLEQIIDWIKRTYELEENQANLLMEWEIEEEIAAVIPDTERIKLIKNLKADNQEVILISDMYLPNFVVRKMLAKADPILESLPLFLSSDYGVLKSNKLLYFEVYRSFKPYYNFGKWIHTGDNTNSDQTQPRYFEICTRKVNNASFNKIEMDMVNSLGNYQGFKVAAMLMRLREEFFEKRELFVIDYIAPMFISYVDWVIRDSLKKGYEALYFVARDGYPLKLIADALIEENGWNIKTKYIYASRRVWRLASYINSIDDDFFADYGGNFADINSKEKFIKAACFENENEFNEFFPNIDLNAINFDDWSNGQPGKATGHLLQKNDKYLTFLMDKAKKQREIAGRYLLQEVDPNEKYAFVEFWGRGYNQVCHSRIWNNVLGKEVPLPYYYARSLTPTEGCCIRHNMSVNNAELFYIEGIFANMPYKSLNEYNDNRGIIEPVIEQNEYNKELFDAMNTLLPIAARAYSRAVTRDNVAVDEAIFDFLLNYYNNNKKNPFIYENFGSLVDAVGIYGEKRYFARPFTTADLAAYKVGRPRTRDTMSITMSYCRSSRDVKEKYEKLYQLESGDNVAGSFVMSYEGRQDNEKMREEVENHRKRIKKLQIAYDQCCITEKIEDRITVIVSRDDSEVLSCLLQSLDNQSGYFCDILDSSNNSIGSLARKLASSRYVITISKNRLVAGLTYRTGSKLIIISPNTIDLYKKDYGDFNRLRWGKRNIEIQYDHKFNLIEMPSDILKPDIIQRYGIRNDSIDYIEGALVSDLFFDDIFKKNAHKHFIKHFPKAKGKTVILYIPKVRKRMDQKNWFEFLDIEKLKELLKGNYFILIDVGSDKRLLSECINPIEIKGFCEINRSKVSARECMLAADIIMGDYRNEMIECALLHKPVFSTGYDYENYIKQGNVVSEILEDFPYPIVSCAEELFESIKNLDQYNYAPITKFIEKYLTYCDGKTASRFMTYFKK